MITLECDQLGTMFALVLIVNLSGWCSVSISTRFRLGSFAKAGLALGLTCLWALVFSCRTDIPRASGPIDQGIYIWQRSWNGPVQNSLSNAPVKPSGLLVLAGEITFNNSEPHLVRVFPDFDTLTQSGIPVGLAIRIGAWNGGFREDDDLVKYISRVASEAVSNATSAGVDVTELQIDFDCAEATLDGYTRWAKTIKKAIEPVPLTITALPCWLRHAEFRQLARASDGFVLQVHSIEPPDGPDEPFTLCDPARARQWIEQASTVGVPFRVSLPTYGYMLEFDNGGKFRRLYAEGGEPSGGDAIIREVGSNPLELAKLVVDLTNDRPANLEGLIWYRMPVETDRLNWPWSTLAAVMDGREPVVSLAVTPLKTQPGLVDIELTNNGETDESTGIEISVRWENADLLIWDALNGFRLTARSENSVNLQGPADSVSPRIGPDERWIVGWLRFDHDTEVTVDVSPVQD
jgi:hypothetical protein